MFVECVPLRPVPCGRGGHIGVQALVRLVGRFRHYRDPSRTTCSPSGVDLSPSVSYDPGPLPSVYQVKRTVVFQGLQEKIHTRDAGSDLESTCGTSPTPRPFEREHRCTSKEHVWGRGLCHDGPTVGSRCRRTYLFCPVSPTGYGGLGCLILGSFSLVLQVLIPSPVSSCFKRKEWVNG